MKYCLYCGAEVEDKAGDCHRCGSEITNHKTDNIPEEYKPAVKRSHHKKVEVKESTKKKK
jgi:uncharacterized membrane protein YvbJ